MKNKLYIFFVMFIALSACKQTPRSKSYTIAVSQPTTTDAWRKAMMLEMERALTFHPNVHIIITDAQDNNEKQIEQIDSLVSLGIDLLIVSPNESLPLTEKVSEVFEKDIPVIVIDREISSYQYNSYIGANNYTIGKIAGQYAANQLEGTGNIVEVRGLTGSSPAKDRHQGFLDGIKNSPGVKITHIVEGGWQKEIARHALQTSQIDFSNISMVFAHNDMMALATFQYLESIGMSKKVPVVGVDGLFGPEGGIQMILDHVLKATILYPTGGDIAINTAIDILEGKAVAKKINLETTVIDSTNALIMQLQGQKLIKQQSDIERQKESLFIQSEAIENQRFFTILLSILAILFLSLAGIVMYQLSSKQKVNKVLEKRNEEIILQRNELERLSEINEAANLEKMEFFTNISHEFKTPLTLILAPIIDLLKSNKFTESELINLRLIKKNAERLQRLIEQFMIFRKIDNNKLQLHNSKIDIVSFTREIVDAFKYLAKERHIDFKFKSQIREKYIIADQNMLDKVLFNILSNAFKFTPENGYIHCFCGINTDDNSVVIKISDNGRGMSKEHVSHAFERFYQGEHYSTKGSGLGLSLSKQIIDMHGGSLDLESEKGVGTTFTIRLNGNIDALSPIDQSLPIVEERDSKVYASYINQMIDSVLKEEELSEMDENLKTILIIEDNPDLQRLISQSLSNDYNILKANDGKSGISTAEEHIPDIILCDLNLPELGGMEVIKHFKNNIITSHIPIIILSAKSMTEDQLKGLDLGVLDYITKPFEMDILHAKIRAHLLQIEYLKRFYSSDLIYDASKTKNTKETAFISSFDQCVQENFENPDFNIDDICKQLNLSRIQLYRKFKSITDTSINDYIQHARLKKSQELLKSTSLTISEIAYKCGFNSASYFSTMFKNQYNITPTEYKK
ncbi:MAG: substrate-binding domain-containing protein [Saprospiraceae bacterium]|nr:substrate-binding domain-containing protein [Saprospiraceae bacterium]